MSTGGIFQLVQQPVCFFFFWALSQLVRNQSALDTVLLVPSLHSLSTKCSPLASLIYEQVNNNLLLLQVSAPLISPAGR